MATNRRKPIPNDALAPTGARGLMGLLEQPTFSNAEPPAVTMAEEPDPVTLADCERVIERGLGTFVQVGNALLKIREERLYRDDYRDFDSYCQVRWGFSRSRAYRLMDAAEISAVLPMGDTASTSERALRELTPIRDQPELLNRVWAEATEVSGGSPTAQVIAETRERLAPTPGALTPDLIAAAREEEAAVTEVLDVTPVPDPAPPKPTPRPKLEEVFGPAVRKIKRDTDLLVRIAEDPRRARMRNRLQMLYLDDLQLSRDAIQSVIDDLMQRKDR